MLPRPPARSSFVDFYGRYLPELWRALCGGLAYTAPPFTVGVRLLGAPPESLRLTVAGPEITVAPGDGPATAWFTFDGEAFRAGSTDLMPRLLRRLDGLAASLPAQIQRALTSPRLGPFLERVAALPGRVVIGYEDDAGDQSRTEVQIGAGGPLASVETTDAEVDELITHLRLSRVLRARARLGGDTGYLLRLAACFEPG